jgi:NAD(P)-dependent dehydrogenase (short-subunit alcohol dehydrogenase family)
MVLLEGRVAIVTGADRGLGRAHALALAKAGAAVVVNDIGANLDGGGGGGSPADDVVAEIVAAGGRAVADRHSVGDWKEAAAIVDTAISAFGRLDIVVNNAGITRDRMLTSSTEDDFDLTIAVHLKGTYAMCHHAAAYWRAESKAGRPVSGRIINTTSGTGMFGNVGQSAYGAAKAGIIGLSLSIARELRRYGVTVNVISPIARTRMTAGLVPDAPTDGFDELDPANASPVVAFLGSSEAGWLTGQVLRVEGAKLVRMQGWRPAGAYSSRSGARLTAEELIDGTAALYETMPAGVTTLNG